MLYKFSVWDQGASYGAKLQGLGYAPLPRVRRSRSCTSLALLLWRHLDGRSIASGLPQATLAFHGALTIFVPYLHARIRAYALSNAWPDAPSSDRRRKAWELLTRLESIHGLAALVNFLVFLWNGRYVTSLYI